MKIAFTSCMDARKKPSQAIWNSIAAHEPDCLIVLGDTIYMDYMLELIFKKPRKWPDQKFADVMYSRYKLQADVPEFRSLVSNISDYYSIWDDHDFAWNNSYVIGSPKLAVPLNKRLISKTLRTQFIDWIKQGAGNLYPKQPSMADLLTATDNGIEEIVNLGGLRIILLDTRYYRSKMNKNETGSLLGDKQKRWLLQNIQSAPGHCLICTGTTLADSDESWDKFDDLKWAVKNLPANVSFLSGDIHKNKYLRHKFDSGEIFDITSSGAARPLGSYSMPKFDASGNFGIIDSVGESLRARCFYFDKLDFEIAI